LTRSKICGEARSRNSKVIRAKNLVSQQTHLVHPEPAKPHTVFLILMSANQPYIVRCNDCEFVSQLFLEEKLALDERDFHSLERLHSVSIWRYTLERWWLVTELSGVHLR